MPVSENPVGGLNVAEAPAAADARTRDFEVWLLNDHVTEFGSVVVTVAAVVGVSYPAAADITLTAHQVGKALVFTGAREAALSIAGQLAAAMLRTEVTEASA